MNNEPANTRTKKLGTEEGRHPESAMMTTKSPVFPDISGCIRLFPLILKAEGVRKLMVES
jgi:hypothetical protein